MTRTRSSNKKKSVHGHVNKKARSRQRSSRRAATRSITSSRKAFQNKADRPKPSQVIQYRKSAGQQGHPACLTPVGQCALISRLRQKKESSPSSQFYCLDFDPCQESFMYLEGLVDHILAKHTLRKVMHCMCGETFTRRIDLTGHVELVHARGKQVNPSTGANANGETLPRGHQISQSLPAGQGVEESGTQFRCTDFASCNRVFENRHDLVAHVRTHRSWASRWARQAQQDGSSAHTKRLSRVSGGSAYNKAPKVATPLPTSTRSTLTSMHKRRTGETLIADTIDLELTATRGVNKKGKAIEAIRSRTITVSEAPRADKTTEQTASQVAMCSSHLGLKLLPIIEQQLRRGLLNELEGSVVPILPDSSEIIKQMQIIKRSTSTAVAEILGPYQFASFIEYQATCVKDATELSAIVFGHTREEEIQKVALGIRSQNRTDAETLLRAYTAAAVTQWVLRVDFRGRYGARGSVGNGPDVRRQHMENFIQKASPDLYSILHRKYYGEFLQTVIAPRLDSESLYLADKLYHILIRLFDGQVDRAWDGTNAGDLRMSLSNTVRGLLFQIFKEAYKLCLLMQKHPTGYNIDFPTWPEKYVPEDMETLESPSQNATGQVCICVGPKISHKESQVTIVPASVLLV